MLEFRCVVLSDKLSAGQLTVHHSVETSSWPYHMNKVT